MTTVANPIRAYVTRTLLFMAGYSAINIAALSRAFDDIERPGAYALALAVAAPVAGQIWATLDYIHRADEFLSARMARQFILAAGFAIALFSAWGFLEAYAGLPHAQGWLIYPLFWLCFGVVSPFVGRTRAIG